MATALAPFQVQVKVNGATTMLDASADWTETDVKAALAAKRGVGVMSGGCYFVVGGKVLNDGAVTTLRALGVRHGGQLEMRSRGRGGGMLSCLEAGAAQVATPRVP